MSEVPPPTLQEFIAWLETFGPDDTYYWANGTSCPCALFAIATGRYASWRDFITDNKNQYWSPLNLLSMQPAKIRNEPYRKYSDLLEFAKKAQAANTTA